MFVARFSVKPTDSRQAADIECKARGGTLPHNEIDHAHECGLTLLGSRGYAALTRTSAPAPCRYFHRVLLNDLSVGANRAKMLDDLVISRYFGLLDRIISDIRYNVEKYGCRNFVFKDSTFTANKEWADQFCDRLIQEELNIKWRCNTRVNLVAPPLLEKMAKAGCPRSFPRRPARRAPPVIGDYRVVVAAGYLNCMRQVHGAAARSRLESHGNRRVGSRPAA